MTVTNAPLSELRVASALRLYERIKLVMVALTLVILMGMGVYLIGIARDNKTTLRNGTETLSILRCAVDPAISFDKDGNPRTPTEARKMFDRCLTAAKKEQ